MNCPHCKTPLDVENTQLKCSNCDFHLNTATKENEFRIDWEHGILKKFHGTSSQVIIPPGIKEIGNHVFADRETLTHVVFPKSLHKIGKDAFLNCSALEALEFPEGLTAISQGAFRNCTSLKHVEVPRNVRSIATTTFQGCSGLESLKMTGSKGKLWRYAFADCTSLKVVDTADIPSEKIDPLAFENTPYQHRLLLEKEEKEQEKKTDLPISSQLVENLDDVFPVNSEVALDEELPPPEPSVITVPEGTKEILAGQFQNDENVSQVILPFTLEKIGERAFYNCKFLSKIEFPPHLKVIEKEAFAKTGLEDVRLPATVRTLGIGVFQQCSALKTVFLSHFVEELPELSFSKCVSLKEIDLKRVAVVGTGAFSKCTGLEVVKGSGVKTLGIGAFEQCTSLKTIDFPVVDEIYGLCFKKCASLEEVTISKECCCLGNLAFGDCRSLVKVEMKNPCLAYGNMPFVNTPYGKDFVNSYQSDGDSLSDICFLYRRGMEKNRLKMLETWQNLDYFVNQSMKYCDTSDILNATEYMTAKAMKCFVMIPETPKLDTFSRELYEKLLSFEPIYEIITQDVVDDFEKFIKMTVYFSLATFTNQRVLPIYLSNHFYFVSVSDAVKQINFPDEEVSEVIVEVMEEEKEVEKSTPLIPSVPDESSVSPRDEKLAKHEMEVEKYSEAFFATEVADKKKQSAVGELAESNARDEVLSELPEVKATLPEPVDVPPASVDVPPDVDLPPSGLDVQPPDADFPPPCVEVPPPDVEFPPPCVEVPPPDEDFPPPCVEVPPPSVETPPPGVETPPPSVETPPPSVVVPPPSEDLPPIEEVSVSSSEESSEIDVVVEQDELADTYELMDEVLSDTTSEASYAEESPLKDFKIKNRKLISYHGKEDKVVLPYSILIVGSQAFTKSNVKEVIIPDSVAFIDTKAFFGCKHLEKVHIAANVVEVKEFAFASCKTLKDVTLESKETIVDKKSFQDTPWGKKNGYHKKIFGH